MPEFWHWVVHVFGGDNPNSVQYLLGSGGFGTFLIPNITSLGILGVVYRKINCHEPGCWRIGHLAVEGTPYHSCHRHHTEIPYTHRRLPLAEKVRLHRERM